MLADVRLLQRLAVGVVTALTRAALANSSNGQGPVAEEALGGGGTVGRTETQAEIERARVVERFPTVAVGVAAGSVHTGNVDVLARLTTRMSDNEISVLTKRDNRIAEAAARLSEDSFRKRVQRMRDTGSTRANVSLLVLADFAKPSKPDPTNTPSPKPKTAPSSTPPPLADSAAMPASDVWLFCPMQTCRCPTRAGRPHQPKRQRCGPCTTAAPSATPPGARPLWQPASTLISWSAGQRGIMG
jgi:hypothetical protein